jgi:hypothetical protein
MAEAAGPTITLWYGTTQSFGAPGHAQRWVNLLGNVSDPDGIAEFEYSLNGGPFITARPKYDTTNALALGPDFRRLNMPGDFNIEIDRSQLAAGANTVLIRATDNALESTQQPVTVNYTPVATWPENYSIDWAGVGQLASAVQVVDGKWSHSAAGVRPVELAYDRVIALGDVTWDDYELLVPITLHAIDPNGFNPISVSPGFGVTFRWTGHTTGFEDPDAYPHYYWWPAGAGFWYDAGNSWGMSLGTWSGNLDLSTGFNVPYNVTYNFRMRVETVPGQGSRYRLKSWPASGAEPAGWLLDGVETLADEPFGSIIFVAHHTDVTIGDLTVTRLPDPNPPVLSEVNVVPTTSSATISWKTNEPATSAVAYGLTTAYANGTVSNPASTLTHSIGLSGLSAGQTYHCRVTSQDVDGNSTSSADIVFVAGADATPPTFSSIVAMPGVTTAALTWNSNEPATTKVHYWLANATTNSVEQVAYTTSHAANLSDLASGMQYFYRVSGRDATGNVGTSAVSSFTTAGANFQSDDFSSCMLEDEWTLVDPTGTAVVQMTGQQLKLSPPVNGLMHDVWITGITVPRVRQGAVDEDFTLEAKFDSALTQSFQSQGILIEEANSEVRVIRAEFHNYNGATKVFVASLFGDSFEFWCDQQVTLVAPMRLRIARTGHNWVVSFALGNGAWQQAASFYQYMKVSHVSFYAGNGASNGHTAIVDYVFNTAAPVTPEDACSFTGDYNANGIPDGCECGLPDCDSDGLPDVVELNESLDTDCDSNGVPDACDPDCDGDGLPNACEPALVFDPADYPSFEDCLNGVGVQRPQESSEGCGCSRFDTDQDGDVDLRDFQAFQRGFAP